MKYRIDGIDNEYFLDYKTDRNLWRNISVHDSYEKALAALDEHKKISNQKTNNVCRQEGLGVF